MHRLRDNAVKPILFDEYECPICRTSCCLNQFNYDIIKFNYCRHCGQKLDWSDIDNDNNKESR